MSAYHPAPYTACILSGGSAQDLGEVEDKMYPALHSDKSHLAPYPKHYPERQDLNGKGAKAALTKRESSEALHQLCSETCYYV